MSTKPTTPAFPGPDRVQIALQAAKDTETLLGALERLTEDIDRLAPLCRVLMPRLRELACMTMSALDDDMENCDNLQKRYEGWGKSSAAADWGA